MNETAITFDSSATEIVIEAFGWSIDENGIIVEDGDLVTATDGESIDIDSLGGVVEQGGEPVPLRDDFVSISQYVSEESE